MCACWRVCLWVLLHVCVCVFLNLTCLVLPELVTSGTSDSDSCSCKSGPLSLSFLFLFLSLSVYRSSPHPYFWLVYFQPLCCCWFMAFTHARVKLCLGFCPPLCMWVCVSVCVWGSRVHIKLICPSSISRVDGDWWGCPFNNSPSQSKTQSCLFVHTVGQEETFLTYQPVMQQEGQFVSLCST